MSFQAPTHLFQLAGNAWPEGNGQSNPLVAFLNFTHTKMERTAPAQTSKQQISYYRMFKAQGGQVAHLMQSRN